MTKYSFMDNRLHVYKRPQSRFWQCSTYIAGKEERESTKTENLEEAKVFAEDWYLELRGKFKAGLLKRGKTFAEAAKQFLREYPVITEGMRNAEYVANYERTLRLYLLPFFGDMLLADIIPGTVQEYRIQRAQDTVPLARSTLHKQIIILRQVLKTAHQHGWLPVVPDLSPPYKTSGKVSHRAWFSLEDYRHLYQATRHRAASPTTTRWGWESEQLHDLVLFIANTGLRPDEVLRLEYRDVTIVDDEATSERILLIEVRGKRGVGFCKSTPGAVRPFRRISKRNTPQPDDRVFPTLHRALFNAILDELGLKFDRDGNRRTIYSLRHSYICFRLMEGADIYQIAKNCRTSVEMIEKHYAVHLKNTLDAAAINVRKSKAFHGRKRRKKRLPNTPSVL